MTRLGFRHASNKAQITCALTSFRTVAVHHIPCTSVPRPIYTVTGAFSCSAHAKNKARTRTQSSMEFKWFNQAAGEKEKNFDKLYAIRVCCIVCGNA